MLTAQVKLISYLKTHAVSIANEIAESDEAGGMVMDVHGYERQQETFALLKLLSLGQRDIDAGRVRHADDVFADLAKGYPA